jgi:hypothetical protein
MGSALSDVTAKSARALEAARTAMILFGIMLVTSIA